MTSVLRQLPLRFRRTFLPLLTVVAMLGSTLGISAAFGQTVTTGVDGGGFEIDGNYAVGDSGGTRDWATIPGQHVDDPSGSEPTPDDDPDTAGVQDLVFTRGSTGQEEDRQDWAFMTETVGLGGDKVDINDIWYDWTGDESNPWLRFGYEKETGTGNTWLAFELNQLFGQDPWTIDTSTTGADLTPAPGDLRITYYFDGQGAPGTESVTIEIFKWTDPDWVNPDNPGPTLGSWSQVPDGEFTAYGRTYLGPGDLTNPQGQTIAPRTFGEASIDLSFLFEDSDTFCRNFGQAWVRTKTSGSGNGQLDDVIKPFPVDIDTCQDITLKKVDTEGGTLTGAEFALFEVPASMRFDGETPRSFDDIKADVDALAGVDGIMTVADATGGGLIPKPYSMTSNTCTTTVETPTCTWADLVPGVARYVGVELVAPTGYDLSSPNWQTTTLGDADVLLTFSNPRIPYWIDVTPETDVNPLDNSQPSDHVFTVKLWDGEWDVTAGDNGEWVQTPAAAGETITLTWNDPDDAHPFGTFADDDTKVGAITSVNGVAVSPTDSTTCTTIDLDGADPGTDVGCLVTVSSSMAGGGYLTATYDLPYQTSSASPATLGPTENGATTNIADVAVRSGATDNEAIADDGTKIWRGFTVDVDPDDAANLLGETHDFTITVGEYGPGAAAAADIDAKVYFSWSGPAGSGITHVDGVAVAGSPAATGTCDVTNGTCVVTVDSPISGDGTLTVTKIEGTIDGEAVTVTTFDTQTDEQDAEFRDDVDGDKTWVEFRLWVSPQTDTNYVDWTHDFVVHVQRSDDNGTTWTPVTGATFAASDWSFGSFTGGLALADLTIDASDCADGTQLDAAVDPDAGTCTISVSTTATGATTLTVTGMTVPFDGGDADELDDHVSVTGDALAASGPAGEDNTADKTWVDYGASLQGDATNLLEESHTFTVTVTRDPEGDLDQATVTLAWTGPDGSTVNTGSDSATVGVDAPDYDSDDDTIDDAVTVTCTPEQAVVDGPWTCDVTVDSDSDVGTGTLSVVSISDGSVLDENDDPATKSFDFGNETSTATKTWKLYKVTMSDDAINLAGEDHEFLVTAWYADSMDGDDPDWQPYDGATLNFGWDGPGDPDPTSCTTGTVNWPSGSTDEYEGSCMVTVSSENVAEGTLTVSGDEIGVADDDPIFLGLDQQEEPIRTAPLEETDSATKTWIAVDVDISPDTATNLVDVPHTFTVTATITSPDGEGGTTTDPLDSDSLSWTPSGDAGAVDLDASTCDDGGTGADGTCTIVVASEDAGSITITLTGIAFTYEGDEFDVDLEVGADGFRPGEDSDTEATKTWISYSLAITPQDATNLLPDYPDHPLTVTLSSEGGAPIAEQTLDLTLTSDNGALITAVDADGDGDLDDLEPPATTAECVTDELGQCDVVISASDPGSATLSASFTFTTDDGEHTIESSDFPSELTGDENGQDADKTWTTYVVTVDGPAINLLGSPHTFTVHVQQTSDGETFTDIEGAVFGTSAEDGSYITISDISASGDVASITGGTCFEEPGTDADGECTVIVESTATTIATVTAYYEGTASESQSSLFYDENTKQWIDYRLDVTPDTADNLVDTDHVFTVTVEVDLGDGEGWQAVPDGSEVALALTGVGTIISTGDGGTIDEDGMGGTCVTDGGTCEVTIRSADAGQSSLVATYTGIAEDGDLINVEESADFSNEETPAIKNWVDYELVMDEDAVNPIGTTHTFTATLTVDTGEGFGPAAGEEVDFTISGVGTVVEVENGTVDEDARGGTCETDDDGTCDIIIASNDVGTTTVTATYGAVVGETSRDFSDSAVKTWVSNPAIDLVKDVDKTTAGIGELVTYTYTITNTGDVTLTNVQLIDEVTITGAFDQLLELIGAAGAITLEPGESTSLTSTHLVTEADLPGPIDNVATVTGEAPDGTEVSDTDDETVDPFGLPAISLNKEADLPGDDGGIKSVGVDPDDPGATVIEYGFVIVNEGNVTLTDVTLQDFVLSELPSGGGTLTFDNATSTVDGDLLSVTIADTTLSPGESTTGTLLFAVRSGDVDLGLITNVAEVTGTAPDDTTVSDEDIENVALVLPDVVPPPPAPAPVLPKTGAEFTDILLWALLTAGLGFALLLISPPGRLAPRRRRRD